MLKTRRLNKKNKVKKAVTRLHKTVSATDVNKIMTEIKASIDKVNTSPSMLLNKHKTKLGLSDDEATVIKEIINLLQISDRKAGYEFLLKVVESAEFSCYESIYEFFYQLIYIIASEIDSWKCSYIDKKALSLFINRVSAYLQAISKKKKTKNSKLQRIKIELSEQIKKVTKALQTEIKLGMFNDNNNYSVINILKTLEAIELLIKDNEVRNATTLLTEAMSGQLTISDSFNQSAKFVSDLFLNCLIFVRIGHFLEQITIPKHLTLSMSDEDIDDYIDSALQNYFDLEFEISLGK